MRAGVRGSRLAARLRVVLALVALIAGGSVSAQAIGDPVDIFLEATGAVAGEDGYRIGRAEARLDQPDGILSRLVLRAVLDPAGVTDAAATLAVASGYGAGIRQPLASFLETRAEELAGNGPVQVRLEEFLLTVDVRGAPPHEAVLTLELPRAPGEAFGPPAAALGAADADVVVREFSDFQCPHCRRYAHEVLPALKDSLLEGGSVRFEFHHFPLDSLHANATPAAEAAQCVADLYGNDAFWAYHDLLFERQAAWQDLSDPEPYLGRLAGDVPAELLDGPAGRADPSPRNRVGTCLNEGAAAATVEQAKTRARALQLSGTPSVFVGGYRLGEFGDPAAYARRMRLELAVASDEGRAD